MLSEEIRNKYQLVIGLEVHAQLLTESKMFAADANLYGQAPNTQISVITLGHPGTLPKVNRKAIAYAIKMGLACNSQITRHNVFARKNYFYPDLPKGYQLTQDKGPICVGGTVPIELADGTKKEVQLNRVHMEEDAGKSIHLAGEADTLVDFNRAGTPLIEIVTEPDLNSPEEAYAFLVEVKKLVKYLDICDGNMEEGSLRCDANISVRLKEASELGKKVEVKNMNSFRNVFRAIEHEHERLIGLIEAGEEVISETRTFDAATGLTSSMRTKEDLNDYRYFPEPDLSPVVISDEWLNAVKSSMPVLPRDLHKKFVEEYGLPAYDASFLTEAKEVAHWFDELCSKTNNYKAASNWMMGPVKSALNELALQMDDFPVSSQSLASLISLVDENKVSHTAASQKIFPALLQSPNESPLEIAQRMNLIQESDEGSLKPIIEAVLAENAAKVKQYKSGKKGLIGMFMGQVMQKSKGKADPKVATKLLTELLEN
ncbi:Asp-tRNA(Asn)/Glu-tRNA(Gln) amidotransferase subunit GatB [Algoriphagus halophytocola]|uniref:Aspartyl/glutamyl-tRNA(Asn/Gln) amidotransferase subunit B n=1 Tax=Algoriphagus halophytocola TaxID=2991499 RepID=A0ABY6MN37_9BACT|nr:MULTISPECIES: Asp-tRNA(Asn)/Glu-tRNA(Gln) amidotransferase subunit GatB [unclassified Algoriphagus]UZD23619.1 Asp-tRNA(Asn)/Glu-tRNA(Gln) amidotransferase subunit GatB [Algoriphagus sp. TR-M5]WBL44912.1 Asp-tRNA(Asn)/Glu-tRNA(Gln) amidotransferase subunit GatB [Algoriphagus sp. TR-M9]